MVVLLLPVSETAGKRFRARPLFAFYTGRAADAMRLEEVARAGSGQTERHFGLGFAESASVYSAPR
jgi:hypothetical protein